MYRFAFIAGLALLFTSQARAGLLIDHYLSDTNTVTSDSLTPGVQAGITAGNPVSPAGGDLGVFLGVRKLIVDSASNGAGGSYTTTADSNESFHSFLSFNSTVISSGSAPNTSTVTTIYDGDTTNPSGLVLNSANATDITQGGTDKLFSLEGTNSSTAGMDIAVTLYNGMGLTTTSSTQTFHFAPTSTETTISILLSSFTGVNLTQVDGIEIVSSFTNGDGGAGAMTS